ncbi:hypothetical protein [Caulobacter sp. FWC2]|uniref:hypothetical protein n=1 Tax=Caulobacter sp. FWC2 TaxID=69664 RepID=UPI000C15BB2C|nr:hypothetical protein [Caulobacter sp. FWC2]PIB90576.1 hypothetical protein CSW62_02725 [Caulobacter sp. FWC2]
MQRFLSARSTLFGGLVLAALVLFHIVIGLPLLSAGHPYWVEPRGDMATMMAGHYAIIDHPWRFPLGVTTALRGEAIPTAIVYTDSLPWLTVAMKALGLGRVLNPLALFLLIAYVAQPLAMVALLRACGVNRTSSLLLGGLLALFFPAWLTRQFGHIALGGQWLLILGLAWAVLVARFGLTRRRIVEISALGLVVAGTHAYHLVPVAACLGAGLLSELLQKRAKAWLHATIALVAFAVGVGFAAWVLGYGGVGQSGGGGALGVYSMNVLGPLWPQASTLAGQRWDNVWFTGTLNVPGQTFEGYNYLGAGVLLVVIAAAAWCGLGLVRGEKPGAAAWRRFGPLALMLVMMTLYAIGPRPYLGPLLMFDIGRPQGAFGMVLGLFRAHGRFFWIVGYAVLAFSIARIDRLESSRLRLGLLGLALALQVADMSQVIRGVRTIYEPTAPYYDAVIRTDPAFEGRPWRFQPVIECVQDFDAWTMVQMSHQALRRHGVSNSGPVARALKVSCDIEPAAKGDAAPGDRTITAVIGDPVQKPALFETFAHRTDCYRFVRGLLCGRGLAQVPGLEPYAAVSAEALAAAPVIYLNKGVKPPELGKGWGLPEQFAIWSDGKAAWLTLDTRGARDFVLFLNVIAIGPSKDDTQAIEVVFDGKAQRRTRITRGVFSVRIRGATPGQPARVELRLPEASAPPPFHGIPDPRLLGIGVNEIRVVPLGR